MRCPFGDGEVGVGDGGRGGCDCCCEGEEEGEEGEGWDAHFWSFAGGCGTVGMVVVGCGLWVGGRE